MSILYAMTLNIICIKDLNGLRYINIINVAMYLFVMIVTYFLFIYKK